MYFVIRMEDCIFCKIVKGEIPSYKIYEDDGVLAFLDIMPFEKGHTLIIPKEHYRDIEDIPEELFLKINKVAQKIAKHFIEKLNCGINIITNNRQIAGQEIFHFHLQVIPRLKKKRFCFHERERYEEGEMEKYQEMLKLEN